MSTMSTAHSQLPAAETCVFYRCTYDEDDEVLPSNIDTQRSNRALAPPRLSLSAFLQCTQGINATCPDLGANSANNASTSSETVASSTTNITSSTMNSDKKSTNSSSTYNEAVATGTGKANSVSGDKNIGEEPTNRERIGILQRLHSRLLSINK